MLQKDATRCNISFCEIVPTNLSLPYMNKVNDSKLDINSRSESFIKPPKVKMVFQPCSKANMYLFFKSHADVIQIFPKLCIDVIDIILIKT